MGDDFGRYSSWPCLLQQMPTAFLVRSCCLLRTCSANPQLHISLHKRPEGQGPSGSPGLGRVTRCASRLQTGGVQRRRGEVEFTATNQKSVRYGTCTNQGSAEQHQHVSSPQPSSSSMTTTLVTRKARDERATTVLKKGTERCGANLRVEPAKLWTQVVFWRLDRPIDVRVASCAFVPRSAVGAAAGRTHGILTARLALHYCWLTRGRHSPWVRCSKLSATHFTKCPQTKASTNTAEEITPPVTNGKKTTKTHFISKPFRSPDPRPPKVHPRQVGQKTHRREKKPYRRQNTRKYAQKGHDTMSRLGWNNLHYPTLACTNVDDHIIRWSTAAEGRTLEARLVHLVLIKDCTMSMFSHSIQFRSAAKSMPGFVRILVRNTRHQSRTCSITRCREVYLQSIVPKVESQYCFLSNVS